MTFSSIFTEKPFPSLRKQTVTALLAVTAAVLLPQLFHLAGVLTGTGAFPGKTWLPMHIPVIIAGIAAGPVAGGIIGAASPVVSCLISGMPEAAKVPFMMAELASLGLMAGIVYNVRIPLFFKVLWAQLAGRILYLGCILLLTDAPAGMVWAAVRAGYPGLILQLCILPLALHLMEKYADRRASQTFFI